MVLLKKLNILIPLIYHNDLLHLYSSPFFFALYIFYQYVIRNEFYHMFLFGKFVFYRELLKRVVGGGDGGGGGGGGGGVVAGSLHCTSYNYYSVKILGKTLTHIVTRSYALLLFNQILLPSF